MTSSSSERRRRTLVSLLLGRHHADAVSQPSLHPSLVASYRLRVVALGTLVSTATLVNLLVYLALSDGLEANSGLLAPIGVGIAILAGAVFTPWNRVLVSRWALPSLYGWSVAMLGLSGLAIYFDGGGDSVLFINLPILTAFFAIAYPQRVQVLLFAVTVAFYSGALAGHGWNIAASDFYVRIAALVTLAYIASVLSGWLVSEMRDRAQSSTAADQRKVMLDTVARSSRRIASLDVSHVLGGALTGAIELGCVGAEAWLLEGDPPSLVLQRRLAINQLAAGPDKAAALFELARQERRSLTEDEDGRPLVACLLHQEREPVGLLVAHVADEPTDGALMVECMELIAAQVSAGLDIAQNAAERRDLEERLAHWAFHDALTDLPNRVLFADRLELSLARIARTDAQIAVLFLDLDGFKEINDTSGHTVGDALLKVVAARIQTCLRPNDTLARFGGDEFVALIDEIDGPEAATTVAQRILDVLDPPMIVNDKQLQVRTSIGIALTGYAPNAESDVVRRADMAMYEAKATGGSVYVVSGSQGPGAAKSAKDAS
jgi:diguanylate cyclase (GGDEF)-like protein